MLLVKMDQNICDTLYIVDYSEKLTKVIKY